MRYLLSIYQNTAAESDVPLPDSSNISVYLRDWSSF